MNNTRKSNGWLLVEQKPENPKYKVLLIPGLMGSDTVFSKLMNEQKLHDTDVHVIAGNPPGFKGQPVSSDFDFSIESYAKLVETLAKAEKIDLIVGHSFGANVLIEVAAREKYKGKLMLISPSLDRESETKDMQLLDKLSRKKLLAGVIWQITYMTMKSVFAPYFDDKELLNTVVADAKKIPKSVGRKTFLGFFNYLDNHGDLAERLAITKVPVYYVRGGKDNIGFTESQREILDSRDLIQIHDIADAGHFAMCDQPAKVAQLIIELLKDT
jgi:pimeloyl-ACP methyl ester carboxylesterase